MEGLSSTIDKNVVLEVKPLRSLVPIFPDHPQAAPMVFQIPSGPFPSGFVPFYPFSMGQMNGSAMQTPERTAPSFFPNGAPGSSGGKAMQHGKKSSQKKARKLQVMVSPDGGSSSRVPRKDYIVKISAAQRDDGDREVVEYVLLEFEALRRRLNQLDDVETPANYSSSVHLKAGTIMMQVGLRTNMRKRIGALPGVEIGDIYFYRMEMYLIGLHCQPMAGIDYMTDKNDSGNDTVALSIVSSGKYDDDVDDSDVLIYTGQGGNSTDKDGQASDQKLERGNLALERSLHRGSEVRVIRGMKDPTNIAKTKVYVYDGIYTIQESWVEKGKTGCSTFKYKLVRQPGQPSVFNIWKLITTGKAGFTSRPGFIKTDLTSGAEGIPVSLFNDVDDEREPPRFTYCKTLIYPNSFTLAQPHSSCFCQNGCQPGNQNCLCIQKNGGAFPYTANGILVCRKPLLYECGPTCVCFPNCKNRVSQTGLKIRLEVFKTRDKGWGLRSWDPIRVGSFICEYAGEAQYKNNLEQGANLDDDDEYAFDTTRTYGQFKWNYDPGLLGEESSGESSEEPRVPYPLVISAKNMGNVARFMNHSCSPNVFWQPIQYEHNEQSFLHIAFFAKRNIPPMTELTFDYGVGCTVGDGDGRDGSAIPGNKQCLCGSPKCLGYFG